jgi:DNA-binding NarL/FixJ family response regulator
MTITDLETMPDVLGWRLVSPPEQRIPLSPRERQIVDLVTGGRTHKEVAFELGVSDVTVRVLYARAMKKLGRSKRPGSREKSGLPGRSDRAPRAGYRQQSVR